MWGETATTQFVESSDAHNKVAARTFTSSKLFGVSLGFRDF
jgi:hypothetical protein